MNSETTPSNLPHPDNQAFFDIEAASTERLNWRLGGEAPTERALGFDESMARTTAEQIAEAKKLSASNQERIRNRLGDAAVESQDR